MAQATRIAASLKLIAFVVACLSFAAPSSAQQHCQTCQPQQNCDPCNGGGECFGPSFFQREPGVNLYWHDPCNCWNDPCRGWNCQLADQPLWYAEADIMFLFRDQEGEFTAATNAAGQALLSSGDLELEHEIGGRYLVGVNLDDWCRVEALYFGQFDWEDDQAIRSGAADLVSPFAGVAPSAFASVGLASRLHNAELNVRRRHHLPPFRWRRAESNFIVGLRYIDIAESFQYVSDVDSALSDVTNKMLGPQIGFQTQFFVLDRAWIDFEAKGGIFANQVELTSSYTNANAITTTFTDDQMACTFAGDAALMFNYHCSKHATFRIGYQALWVGGMSLATQNMTNDINILTLGPANVEHADDVVYHGAVIGFVWAQ